MMRRNEEREQFEIWVQMLQRNGMETHIRESSDVAIQAYYTNPSFWTLEYIAKLNPGAAEILMSMQGKG